MRRALSSVLLPAVLVIAPVAASAQTPPSTTITPSPDSTATPPTSSPPPTTPGRRTRAPHTPRTPGATTPAATNNSGGHYYVPSDTPAISSHPEGEYGGVTPGETPKTDHPRPKHTPPKGQLSWIGFEPKNGGAQLFFQAIAPFEITQHVEGSTLVLFLGNLTRLGPNTFRALDTRYFDNPIARVETRRVGAARATQTAPAHPAGIEVRIAFKNAKDVRPGDYRTATEADGYSYAYVGFAEGADAQPTVQDPEK